MGGLFPAFDRDFPGRDNYIDGRAIGEQITILSEIADRYGCLSFDSLIDAHTMIHEVLGDAEALPEYVPEVQWYSTTEGLRTVRTLIHHIRTVEQMASIEEGDAVLYDLEELERALEKADEHGARFHLLVDI